jgi:hypothetical protein
MSVPCDEIRKEFGFARALINGASELSAGLRIKMNWTTIGTVGVVAIGWLVVHLLAAHREGMANRRKQVIDYLIGAYHKLNSYANTCVAGA